MILVTGSTGLVGRHLLIKLATAGKAVKALYRSEIKKKEVEDFFAFAKAQSQLHHISWVEGDITDLPQLEKIFKGIKYVYHCAAYISFDPYDFKELSKVNIEGTANVVNLCLSNKVKKLVYLSSIATLAKLPYSPITEDNHWDPNAENSVYALTKYGAEMEVWRGTEEGLKAIILNPGIILGEGSYDSGSGALFKHVIDGRSFYPKGGSGVIDVKDLVNLMLTSMATEIHQKRFISISYNISYQDLFKKIATALKKEPPKYALTNKLLAMLTFLDFLKGLITRNRKITRVGYKSLQTVSLYDNERATDTLGFTGRPLEKTLERITAHLKATYSY